MSETRRRRPVGLEFAALNKDTSVAATNARAVDDQLFDNTNVTLGDGQFANVKLVRLKQEFIKLYAPKLHPVPERAALKTCKVRVSANERSPVGDKLRRELDYYRRKCSHPNLIVYYKLLEQRSSPTPPSFTRIFMEYMDLRSLAHVAERLAAAGITAADRVELARAVGVQVLCALQYLHEVEGIMHRDIKEGNTLINTEGRVKLCDFDTAREIVVDLQRGVELGGSGGINALENGGGGGGGGARPILPPDTVMPGTESYTAPEVIKVAAGCRYNEKCDVWSFAVMIFKIATGTDAYKQRDVLRAGTTTFSSFVDFAKLTDDDLRDLLERCLVDDPQQRYTVTEALHHKFFTGDGHKFFDPNAALPSDTLNHLQLLGIRVGTESEMSDMRQHLVEHRKSASKEKAASAAAAAAPTTAAATAGFQPAIPRSMTDGMLSPTASGLGDSVNRSNVVTGAASEADLTTMLGYDAQPTNGGTPRSSPPQTGLTNGATAMFPPSAVPQAVSDNQLVPNPDFTVPTNQSQQPPQPVVTVIPWTGEQRSQATSAYKQVVYRREAEAVKALKVLLRKYNIGEALDGTNSNINNNNNNNNNNAAANVPLVAMAA